MWLVLIVLLILLLGGGLGYGVYPGVGPLGDHGFGHWPGGIIGVLVVVILVLLIAGR